MSWTRTHSPIRRVVPVFGWDCVCVNFVGRIRTNYVLKWETLLKFSRFALEHQPRTRARPIENTGNFRKQGHVVKYTIYPTVNLKLLVVVICEKIRSRDDSERWDCGISVANLKRTHKEIEKTQPGEYLLWCGQCFQFVIPPHTVHRKTNQVKCKL